MYLELNSKHNNNDIKTIYMILCKDIFKLCFTVILTLMLASLHKISIFKKVFVTSIRYKEIEMQSKESRYDFIK